MSVDVLSRSDPLWPSASRGTATFVFADDDKANGNKANGDKLFTTSAGTGTVTSTGSESTTVNTITGGTGRFDDATGTITVTDVGVTVSIVGSIVTSTRHRHYARTDQLLSETGLGGFLPGARSSPITR
jgi:hypothetical protein